MFEFSWLWAFALLPLPWVVRRFAPAAKVEQQAGLQVPFIDNLAAVAAQSASSRTLSDRGPLLLGVLVWACLVTAVAKPQWLGEPIPQPLSGRDIMLAVDLSESMLESDFLIDRQQVDRLTATKVVAGDFIERREGDRVGLLLFADQAYLQAPLTRDRATVRQLLDEAQVGLAGRATAIGDVIGLAVKRFKTLQSSQRILVLMTDGKNSAGALAPEAAIELAQAEGLTIYTVGIGRDSGGISFMGLSVGGGSSIDEALLTQIAQQTGGRYFRAQDLDQLVEIYALLDELEPVEQDADFFRPVSSLYQWPLGLGVLLLALLLVWQRQRGGM